MPKVVKPPEPVVYVIQRPRPKPGDGWMPDFSTAQPYGRLEFIFEPSDRIYADPREALKKAAARLNKFNPEHDLLLFTIFGDPAASWLVIQHLTALGFKKLKYLYWSKGAKDGVVQGKGFYYPVEIDVSITQLLV